MPTYIATMWLVCGSDDPGVKAAFDLRWTKSIQAEWTDMSIRAANPEALAHELSERIRQKYAGTSDAWIPNDTKATWGKECAGVPDAIKAEGWSDGGGGQHECEAPSPIFAIDPAGNAWPWTIKAGAALDAVLVCSRYTEETQTGQPQEQVERTSARPVLSLQPLGIIPPNHPRWRDVFEARAALAKDREKGVLFTIDRLTNREFIRYAGDFPTDVERRDREAVVARLINECLVPRLKARFEGAPVADVSPPLRTDLEDITGVFSLAIGVEADPRLVLAKRAFRSFAAGGLRDLVVVEDFEAPEVVCDADSAFVFLFAEFALLCLEQDPPVKPAFWSALLPVMVEMQAIYVARMKPLRAVLDLPLLSWPQPPEAPRPGSDEYAGYASELEWIRRLYSVTTTREALVHLMACNLHAAADRFAASPATGQIPVVIRDVFLPKGSVEDPAEQA